MLARSDSEVHQSLRGDVIHSGALRRRKCSLVTDVAQKSTASVVSLWLLYCDGCIKQERMKCQLGDDVMS